MNTVTSYRRSAERCRELADRAQSEEERKLLLKLAASWDWLSRDADSSGTARARPSARGPDRRRAR